MPHPSITLFAESCRLRACLYVISTVQLWHRHHIRGGSRGGDGGSSPGQIFRIKDLNFLDSFLQIFCRLQLTGRCPLITNHKAFQANIKRLHVLKASLTNLLTPCHRNTYHYQIKLSYLYSQNKRYSEPHSSANYTVIYQCIPQARGARNNFRFVSINTKLNLIMISIPVTWSQ